MRVKILLFLLMLSITTLPMNSFAEGMADYLILQDIGPYKLSKPEKMIPGFPPIGGPIKFDGPVVVAGTGHFPDHTDTTYEVMYLGDTDEKVNPTVKVTQHAGTDSDKWLLHEIEDRYRDSEIETLGLVTEGAIFRKISGYRVYWLGIGGGSFTWISNNVLIRISYTDLQCDKPEPTEVVQAYLQKFPSTIPSTLVLDKAHDVQWIKDEMERRLWLADKWVGTIQPSDPKLNDKLEEVVDNMKAFLDYREKYFSVSASDEKDSLDTLLGNNDQASLVNKVTVYKEWWNNNKGSAISLP